MGKPTRNSARETRPVKSKKERQEFGPGKEGLVICPKCSAAYYKKSWHQSDVNFNGKETSRVKFVLCPADQMMKNGQFEGRVLVKNLPKDAKEEVINLIKNVAAQAYEKDPMHRLIKVGDKSDGLVALFTENELAVSVGKKIAKARGGKAKVGIKYSEEPSDVAYVVVEF